MNLDEKGLRVLHADLTGPRKIALNSEGNDVAYGLIAVLRLQSADMTSTILLPWIRTMATKGQAETYNNTKQIIAEIEGASLGGISYEKRVNDFTRTWDRNG